MSASLNQGLTISGLVLLALNFVKCAEAPDRMDLQLLNQLKAELKTTAHLDEASVTSIEQIALKSLDRSSDIILEDFIEIYNVIVISTLPELVKARLSKSDVLDESALRLIYIRLATVVLNDDFSSLRVPSSQLTSELQLYHEALAQTALGPELIDRLSRHASDSLH